LHCSADTVGVITKRGQEGRMMLQTCTRNANETWIRILNGRNDLRGAGIDGRMILENVARVESESKWISSWISRGLLLWWQ